MSVHGGDISWQTLRRIVHDWVGTSAELTEVKPLHGGSISSTVAITTQAGDRAVLKISPHRVDRSYIQETFQLNVLRTIGLPTPQVYACSTGSLDEPVSYLLMEFLDGMDLSAVKNHLTPDQFDHVQMHLAELLQQLHGQTHSHYTRLTEGDREEFDNWSAFYKVCYESIVKEAEKLAIIPIKTRKLISKLHSKLDRLLVHTDCPRLIHGDLWSSNVLAGEDSYGKWWVTGVLDPMCKYAHAESEIAYLELFHTVTPAFLRAYQSVHRLPAEYHSLRKPIYQAYELINHVQMFGAEYLKPLLGAMDRLTHWV